MKYIQNGDEKTMITHNPQQYAASLSAKLASRSRHVCLFLGAGVARACSLPDISTLQETVKSDLEPADRDLFERQLDGRNIEQVLSRLRRIANLISGSDIVDGLTANRAEELDIAICQAIVRALDISHSDIKPVKNLASWLARADYNQPVELFTVNYDLLIETALEEIGVPYFDGFVGNLRARFRTELVEPSIGEPSREVPSQFVRIWKLHGSVNWMRTDDNQIVRIGQPVPEELPAAIYPSDTKYEESRRVPFIVLQDRLRRAFYQPETLVLISGYSFGDAHLNEMIFDAATRRERSEFVVFCHNNIPEELKERACRTPNIQVIGKKEAILGGVIGTWKPLDEPIPNLWNDKGLILTDFNDFASYLARSSMNEDEMSKGNENSSSQVIEKGGS